MGIDGFADFLAAVGIGAYDQRIIKGEPFTLEVLADELPVAETIEKAAFCHLSALRSVAIIQLRLAEEGLSQGPKEKSDAQIVRRRPRSARHSPAHLLIRSYGLRCIGSLHGLGQQDLKYLRFSYQLGPNEGWIALIPILTLSNRRSPNRGARRT
jgi:hypothetical protein